MKLHERRKFLKLAGTAGAVSALGGLALPLVSCRKTPTSSGRVVVVGGGFGGATCAKYLRRFDPNVEVTLVERDAQFVTCPFSNTVLGGLRGMDEITQSYAALRDKHGVTVIQDEVIGVDPDKKTVSLKGNKQLEYDKLVLSPGIDFRWNAIDGYDQAASGKIPHAWKAGEQTVLLRKQLEAMEDGGVFVIVSPANPFRCPPGPYERASLVAYYFKNNKPKSKILILDAKPKFSKQALFMQGWEQEYPGMIEWVKDSDGGKIVRIDAAGGTLYDQFDKTFKGDVINLIPPQKAGTVAEIAGLTNADGWCPVDQRTFESTVHKDVHVIGDSCIAGAMPKSGYAANSQGKVCAAAIVTALNNESLPEPSYVNTCYSLIAPDYGISVAAVYRIGDQGITGVENAGGVSPMDADADFRHREAEYASGWYASITADAFG